MDANSERMPGDAEADAAAAGMVDLYGRSLAKGDEVRYRRDSWPAGRSDGGRVVAFHRGRILIETDDDVVEVEADELLPF
jgi:hypothetical protein